MYINYKYIQMKTKLLEGSTFELCTDLAMGCCNYVAIIANLFPIFYKSQPGSVDYFVSMY